MLQPAVPQKIADTIVSPEAHADRQQLDNAYMWLRQNAPLARIEPTNFQPMWAVTRHADIVAIERNVDVFKSGGAKSTILVDRITDESTRALHDGRPSMVLTLIEMDPPMHLAYRRLTMSNFLPKALKNLDNRIKSLANESANKMIDLGGACDFAQEIALNYPLRVIMELLGVPSEDEPLMLRLTQEFFGVSDADITGKSMTFEERALFQQSKVGEFAEYFGALIAKRQAEPKDDIASVLANAKIDEEPLDPEALLSYFFVISVAGHDTASSTISSGMWQLAENPNHLKMLKQDPPLIENFVQECVRWESPVRSFMRNNVADVEISGQHIPAGEWLMLCFLSGNRDEEVFESPFSFDITRAPGDHIGYGRGPHLCLGKHLANLEMVRLWEQIIPRLDSVELDGTPTRVAANFVSGPKSVPIRYSMQ